MNRVAINILNISKEYKLGERIEYGSLRDDITNAVTSGFKRLFSKENSRDRSENNRNPQYFWSLEDISFDIRSGEIIGIIGRNGAGKSTLLKVIAGITEPTEGRIDIYGRIGSLLEVGTGFHQELTGRENIYLNGAILGMRRNEIERKFDEIVAFSEVEKFIDTPVKFYSTGMRVRLGFSVAAHLEPEILLIDEVLAVGDAAFQKKCLGKLDNIATSEGRTVLFVSHDMAAILALCDRAVLLDGGKITAMGETNEVVEQYFSSMTELESIPLDQREDRSGDGSVKATSILIENADLGKPIQSRSKLKITVGYMSEAPVQYLSVELTIRDFKNRAPIFHLDSDKSPGFPDELPSEGKITCITDHIYLTSGRCVVDIRLRKGTNRVDRVEQAGYFDVETEDIHGFGKIPTRNNAFYILKNTWSFDKD
jgi:homopolymeric O-antigen transport system ATP-binding protein